MEFVYLYPSFKHPRFIIHFPPKNYPFPSPNTNKSSASQAVKLATKYDKGVIHVPWPVDVSMARESTVFFYSFFLDARSYGSTFFGICFSWATNEVSQTS
jgi:hypothetical protein